MALDKIDQRKAIKLKTEIDQNIIDISEELPSAPEWYDERNITKRKIIGKDVSMFEYIVLMYSTDYDDLATEQSKDVHQIFGMWIINNKEYLIDNKKISGDRIGITVNDRLVHYREEYSMRSIFDTDV